LLGPLKYKVLVRANAKSGKLLVDGSPAGTLSNGQATVDVASGEHVFRLESTGEEPIAENVRVRVDGTTKVRLDRNAIPERGDQPDGSSDPKNANHVSEPPDPPKTGGNAQRTWGYITLGAGGLLLAGGGVAAARLYQLSHNTNFQNYRAGLRPTEDACTEANRDRVVPGAMTPAGVRATCSEGKTVEAVEIILLVSGVVVAGTGLTLVLSSKGSPKAAVTRFEPKFAFGKDRADVGLLMHF